jgi:hypothetical protein
MKLRNLSSLGLVFSLMAGALGSVVSAQTPHLKIRVLQADTVDGDVRDELLPLISADPHYTSVNDSSWDVEVVAVCIQHTQEIACSYTFLYAPDKYLGATALLDAVVVVDSDSGRIARRVFTKILDDTTPDRIKSMNDTLGKTLDYIMRAVREHDAQSNQKQGTG